MKLVNDGIIAALVEKDKETYAPLGHVNDTMVHVTSDERTKWDGIAALQTEVQGKASQQDLEDLRAEMQGYEFRTVTEMNEVYSVEVPAKVMPFANVNMVGGKNVVWNQLANPKSINVAGVTAIVGANGLVTISGTATQDGGRLNYLQSNLSVVKNHKYYISTIPNAGDLCFTSLSNNIAILLVTHSSIYTFTEDCVCGFGFNRGAGANYNTSGYIQMIDLTLLYGAGNEPTTVEQFKRDYPADYYPFSAPTIKSANVKSVDSIGFNLIDPSKCLDNTYMATDGVAATHPTYTRFVTDYIHIDPKKNYYIENCVNLFNAASFCYFDANKTFIKYSGFLKDGIDSTVASGLLQSGSESIPSNACYIRVNGEMAHKNNIMLCVSNTAVPHVPFRRTSLPIPSSVRSLDGYSWSAGDVYNYIDLDRKVFVKRVGRVDLGTKTWRYVNSSPSHLYFATDISDAKRAANQTAKATIVCAKYSADSGNNVYNNTTDKIIAIPHDNDIIMIHDTSYTDASAFKTAVSGVYLYYELATPVETPIDLPSNILQVDAGSTIIFEQEDGNMHIPVPSEISYIKHLGGDV